MSGAAADWRRFLTGRYAAFRTLAISDAIAVALNGDSLSIPLVTTLGASPALAGSASGRVPPTSQSPNSRAQPARKCWIGPSPGSS